MCQFFGVSRSGYYDFVRCLGRPERDAELGQVLREQQAHVRQTYGYRRMWLWLESQGIHRNPKTVLRVMKKYEVLAEIRRPRKWQQMGQQVRKYENLLNREFHADKPNSKWVTDISYIQTRQGILYLSIDIENSIKAAQSKGYEQWAKIHNLKQAAKTMNFLTEHKIEQYADLVSRTLEMAAESGQAADALKNAEKRLAEMAVLIKNVSTYQKTKPVYDAYRKARNREKYRAGQEQAIILHEAAARSLKAAGIAKLPNLAALQSEYEALQAQKEALYADYGKLKKKVREYDIIKQNIDSILQADRQPEREKGTERG